MRVWLHLLPAWPADEVERLTRAGWIPVVDARPRGLRAPVAVRCALRPPDDLRPGDVALTRCPVRGPAPDLAGFASACRERGIEPWAVVHSPAQVRAARAAGVGCWIRGCEAGGLVGPSTALVLLRAAHGAPFVVEGLGPRAMAASLAVGAHGIVVGAHLWATRNAPVDPAHREVLAGARSGRDTVVLGEAVDRRVRMLGRGAPETRKDLARAEQAADPDAFDEAARAALADWPHRPDAAIPAPQCVAQTALLAGRDAVDAVRVLVADVVARRDALRSGHPLAAGRDPLGCGTPIVQGPMANVAEGTALARAVAAAGAMPFCALGALDPGQARAVAEGLAGVDRPWGLGIIGFDVVPHRDAHLDLAREVGPDAVILAGGSPELAVALQEDGLVPWLHTPSGRLVARALDKGVGAVVLEGHEAGGHVGFLTSAGLWEEGLAAVEAAGAPVLVVLAGGIGDAPSAAFAAAMAAGAEARGARIALQAGTAFFFTREILEGGQITPAYQAAALEAEDTVLVGATVNLPLRCAPNAYTRAARAEERGWLAEGLAAPDRRLRMERHNLGRTRVAAKGIERDPEWGMRPDAGRYRAVPEPRQADEGAFTMGQGATVTTEVRTVVEVVRALSTDARALLDTAPRTARWGPARGVAGTPTATRASRAAPVVLRRRGAAPAEAGGADPIAVVGLGCILPGALDVPAFWHNLVGGESAIAEIPPERWDPARYWDPDAGASGPVKTYSRLAGAVRGFTFDPLRYRIPPKVVGTIDPSQRLALAAAEQAVIEAGWLDGGVDPHRAAVVLGNAMGGEFAKHMSLRVRFREVLEALGSVGAFDGLSDGDRADLYDRVEARLAADLPPVEVDSMAGLLSNVIAGRVTAWLDWMGGNMTVDAACAASLAALGVAVDWLRTRRVDAVLTGGVDTDLTPESFVGFSRTHALSSGTSRPFAAGADGFVMGEGCGVLALKRLDDALRDGDAVWAVIRGVGQSSDGRGRGITAPRDAGQRLAIDRAYAEAGFGPEGVGMVEAHGTGTALGDVTEVGVLSEVFRNAATPTWLGSVKSNLGHLKGAAGAAGLLKACLSVATGVIPPTIEAGPVKADLGLAGGPLRLPRAPVPFPRGPRRASVSAFGFGGTNFHVLLEEPPPAARRPEAVAALSETARPLVQPDPVAAAWPLPDAAPEGPALHAWGAPDRDALARAVREEPPAPLDRAATAPWRVATVSAERERAAAWVEAGDGAAPGEAIHLGHGGAAAPWWLIPGQGAQKAGAVASVRRFAAGAAVLDALEAHLPAAASLAGLPPLHTFADLEHEEPDTRRLHLLLYGLALAWGGVLRAAGVPMAGAIGHSLGEYAALALAGYLDPAEGLSLVATRGAALHACPPGAMLAVALPEAEASARADAAGLALATVNGPEACVVSGAEEAVEALREALEAAGHRAVRLSVDRAFHSPGVAPAASTLAEALATVAFRAGEAPVYSGATAAPFGNDPGADLVAGVVRPVRFADALRAADPALVVEVGPGRTLAGLAAAVVPGARAVALDPRPGADGPWRAAAALLATGHPGLAVHLAPVRPAPAPAVARPAPSPAPRPPAADPGWRARAEAVQDLRIAALADPALEGRYREARAALLADLAAADAGQAGTGVPAPALAPPPPATPDPAPAEVHEEPPAEDVRAVVVAAICEVTGYPASFIEEDADLEGDLGVDSIRKMEILGLLQERLGFTAAESDYADLAQASLSDLVAYVTHRRAAKAVDAPEARDGWTARLWALAPLPLADAPPVKASLPAPGTSRREGGHLVWRLAAGEVHEALAEGLALARAHPDLERLTVLAAEDPAGAAAAAFARSLGRERGIAVRAVHPVDDPSEARLAAEVHAPDRPARVRVGPRASEGLHLVPTEPDPPDLPREPVVLATGGVRGILVPCLAALGDLRPRVVLLGRTEPGPAEEETLDALREAGVRVTWRRCDVTDARAVAEAAAWTRETHGRIDVVVHAAGLLADAPVERLDAESAAQVLAPKVDGAALLQAATEADEPALWVAFSSLVAHTGNPGQAAYAAANAALEAMPHPTAARSVALAWTAWSGVGMAASTGVSRLLAARGLTAIPPQVGGRAFREALGATGAVVVTADPSPAPPLPWPLSEVRALVPGHRGRFGVALDPAHPALADHRVGGRPLVPAALWLGALLAAARATRSHAGPWAFEGFRIHAPTFVESPRTAEIRIEGLEATVHVGDTVVAEATVFPWAPLDDAAPPPPLRTPRAAAPLYREDLLFHGPTWRVLDRVEGDGNGGVRADLRAPNGVGSVATAVDAAHQVLSAWAGRSTGWLGLPVGASRWVVDALGADGPLRLETAAVADGDGVLGEVRAVTSDGRVVAAGREVRLRRAARWPADAPDALEGDE